MAECRVEISLYYHVSLELRNFECALPLEKHKKFIKKFTFEVQGRGNCGFFSSVST